MIMKRKLIYTPVIYINLSPVLRTSQNKFHNVTKGKFRFKFKPKNIINIYLFCDSGGFQVYRIEQNRRKKNGKKKWIIDIGIGIKDTKDCLYLDPIEICRRYGEMDIEYGITVDIPLCHNATPQEFQNNLLESFEWSKTMFEFRPKFCPNTNFLTPLHYMTKQDLYDSFELMNPLNPDGYAIPARGTRNEDDFIALAYAMCFLFYKGVKVFHMLGSARPEIIILGAAAIGLQMFDQVSFDSTSWHTAMYHRKDQGPPKYLDRDTLCAVSLYGKSKIRLMLPKKIGEKVLLGEIDIFDYFNKDLIFYHNIMAIKRYTEKIIKLTEDINQLKHYVSTANHLVSERYRIILALDLLKKTKTKGYSYVDYWYDEFWL